MIIYTSIIIFVISAALMILLRMADSVEEENRMMESGMESVRMYNEALEQRTEKIRRLRHDTLGLLQAIESAGDYAKDKKGQRKEGPLGEFGMPLLDAITELKQNQCRENSISFEIHSTALPARTGTKNYSMPDETDLCLLIQNLLENAYEANLRIQPSKRRSMALAISQEGDKLMIQVSNSLPAGEKPTFNTWKPNPKLHGIGTKIIDDIIRKYDGTKTVRHDAEGNMLTIEAELKLAN